MLTKTSAMTALIFTVGAIAGPVAPAMATTAPSSEIELQSTITDDGFLSILQWSGQITANRNGKATVKFDLNLPEGYSAKLLDDGTATVADEEGNTKSFIDDPIAISTSGNKVIPGKWRIDGKNLELTLPNTSTTGATFNFSANSVGETPGDGLSFYLSGSFVKIPRYYVYNPKLGTLHDYCTASPDKWNKADFRGPCAEHDMCLEAGKRSNKTCNDNFRYMLRQNCVFAYAGGTVAKSREKCLGIANVYWAVVTAKNP